LWKAFWKWALPKKTTGRNNVYIGSILRDHYLSPLLDQLSSSKPLLIDVVSGVGDDHVVDSFRYERVVKRRKLTWKQKLKCRTKEKLRRMKPVLTTQGKIEDLEYD
jgi:hypothetical protein